LSSSKDSIAEYEEKEKTIDDYAKKALSRIDKRVIDVLDEEYAGFWSLLKLFSDGKTKRWKEIKNQIDLSQVTISKRLKKLQEYGIIERKIIPSFPPRTAYGLKKSEPNTTLSKWLFSIMETLEAIDDHTKASIKNSFTDTNVDEIFDSLLRNFEWILFKELKRDLLNPVEKLEKNNKHLFLLFSTVFAFKLLQQYWTIYEVCNVSLETRRHAVEVLTQKIKANDKMLGTEADILVKEEKYFKKSTKEKNKKSLKKLSPKEVKK
jgi:DNA-binding HxlR family transcriptional regulator